MILRYGGKEERRLEQSERQADITVVRKGHIGKGQPVSATRD
jgi:hypothetical protein